MEHTTDDIETIAAVPTDARGIRHVSYDSWLVTYPNEANGITVDDIRYRLKDTFSDEKIAKLEEQITDAIASEDKRYFVAKEGEKIIGYCYAVRHQDKNQLQAIYVSPDQVGKGIGTKLWQAARDFFDPKKDTCVEVAIYNENAILFYKNLGFVETGKIFSDEKFKMQSGSIITQTELVIKAKNDLEQ